MKLHESGTALAEDMGVPVSRKTAKDPDGGPYPVYPSGKPRDETSWQDELREEVLP